MKNYINYQSLFITATNTDVGKTYATSVLLKALAKEGLKVGYFKPIETGVVDKPVDGTSMLNLVKSLNKDFDVTIDEVVPYQFSLPAAPFVAKRDRNIDLNFLIPLAPSMYVITIVYHSSKKNQTIFLFSITFYSIL